ncbi:MAG: DUF1223 domain-containing protein [Hyphomicrobium sp.]
MLINRLLAFIVVLAGTAVSSGRLPAQDLAVTPVAPDEISRPLRGVVELYTSQGCSSCPPADALLKHYADTPDTVALSFPVDYWDYLGWKDTLATPRNSERQRTYAKARGDGAVYTPQVVINGVAHVNGASQRDIDKALEVGWPKLVANQVPVRFWNQGGTVVIQTGSLVEAKDGIKGTQHSEATVWLAIIKKSAEVMIPRGENAGKTITYTNVVRELAPVGMWSGKPMQIRLSRNAIIRPESEACAILLQAGDGGPIIGAAWMGF